MQPLLLAMTHHIQDHPKMQNTPQEIKSFSALSLIHIEQMLGQVMYRNQRKQVYL